jgi:methyl-accepting chemotaxis protein
MLHWQERVRGDEANHMDPVVTNFLSATGGGLLTALLMRGLFGQSDSTTASVEALETLVAEMDKDLVALKVKFKFAASREDLQELLLEVRQSALKAEHHYNTLSLTVTELGEDSDLQKEALQKLREDLSELGAAVQRLKEALG